MQQDVCEFIQCNAHLKDQDKAQCSTTENSLFLRHEDDPLTLVKQGFHS